MSLALQAQSAIEVHRGQSVRSVIDRYRDNGLAIAYSTEVLGEDLVVQSTPRPGKALDVIRQILQPHGLDVRDVNGMLVVVRRSSGPEPAVSPDNDVPPAGPQPIPELVVAASRYEILRKVANPGVYLDQRQMQQLPTLADDPVRAAQRVPGAAGNGVSARPHFRGSDTTDTGIVLNGNRLLEPFHLRNFQSLFSSIDSHAVEGIEVYTGSMPVRYGNQVGGVIVIDTIDPHDDPHTEIGVSVFNTSVLNAGSAMNSKLGWIASARRGNLDLLLDEEFGEPAYNDVFGQVSYALSDTSQLTVNALVANNDVHLITEKNPDEPESSTNKSRNAQYWANWRKTWSNSLESTTMLSLNTLKDHRIDVADDPEELLARIDDYRDIRASRIAQNWIWQPTKRHEIRFGAAFESQKSHYNYDAHAEYRGVFAWFAGLPNSIDRVTNLTVDGNAWSLYASDQWSFSKRNIAQIGLRWDRQTYTGVDRSWQVSPRIGLVRAVGPRTELRVSIGRYYQAQGIHELQVEDGLQNFFRAQRTDSVVVGIQHRLQNGYALRAEAYAKEARYLRPRFENVLNPITILAELKPDRTEIGSTTVEFQGLELSIDKRIGKNLNWWASYVLSSVEDRNQGTETLRSWDQPQAFQAGLSWSFGQWQLGALASAHSGWPVSTLALDDGDPANPQLSIVRRNEDRYNTFVSIDLRLQRDVSVHIGELSYFFELSNVLNRQNRCCIDYEADVTADGTVTLNTERKNWLPLLPAAGILWRF